MIKTLSPEAFNRWRVWPRAALVLYFALCWDTHDWYTALDSPSAEQSAYAALIIGAAAAWFKFYVDSGATLKEIKESRNESV